MAEGILFKLFPKIHLLPRPSMENFSPKGSLVGKLPELMKTERHKGSLCVAPAIVATGAHIVWEEGPHSIAPPFMSFLSSIWMSLGFGVVTDKTHSLYEYNVGSDMISVSFSSHHWLWNELIVHEKIGLISRRVDPHTHSSIHAFIHTRSFTCSFIHSLTHLLIDVIRVYWVSQCVWQFNPSGEYHGRQIEAVPAIVSLSGRRK